MHAAPRAASAWRSNVGLTGVKFACREAFALIGRIVRSVDFERVMAMPSQAKSKHFILQYLDGEPSLVPKPCAVRRLQAELSTRPQEVTPAVVDDVDFPGRETLWLGLVVPKRHAKRSVTRSLLKRQMRAAVLQQQHQAEPLKKGLWVLRLRAVFEVSSFKSAASQSLAEAARDELQQLLVQALQRGGGENQRYQGVAP